MALDLFLDVQFLDRKPIINWEWVRSLNMKKFRVQVEGICQAVCRIDAHDQGAMVQFSQFHTRGRGHAGLYPPPQTPSKEVTTLCNKEFTQARKKAQPYAERPRG